MPIRMPTRYADPYADAYGDSYALLGPLLAAEAAAEGAARRRHRGRPTSNRPSGCGCWSWAARRPEPGPLGAARRPRRGSAATRLRLRSERPYDDPDGGGAPAADGRGVEDLVLAAEAGPYGPWPRLRRLPGPLPAGGLGPDVPFRPHLPGNLPASLGISQGSIGPLRSRCLSWSSNDPGFEGWIPGRTG